jgi:hypothetical protein
MSDRLNETLSALIDGEAVDFELLAEALESRNGRDALIAFARSRAALAADPIAPRAEWQRTIARELTPGGADAIRMLSYRAAAGLLAASLLLGFAADRWWRGRADAPPRAQRVLRFDAADWRTPGGAQ